MFKVHFGISPAIPLAASKQDCVQNFSAQIIRAYSYIGTKCIDLFNELSIAQVYVVCIYVYLLVHALGCTYIPLNKDIKKNNLTKNCR